MEGEKELTATENVTTKTAAKMYANMLLLLLRLLCYAVGSGVSERLCRQAARFAKMCEGGRVLPRGLQSGDTVLTV